MRGSASTVSQVKQTEEMRGDGPTRPGCRWHGLGLAQLAASARQQSESARPAPAFAESCSDGSRTALLPSAACSQMGLGYIMLKVCIECGVGAHVAA